MPRKMGWENRIACQDAAKNAQKWQKRIACQDAAKNAQKTPKSFCKKKIDRERQVGLPPQKTSFDLSC